MRALIVSILLAGGLFPLAACGTLPEPNRPSLAEWTAQCHRIRGVIVPTGRQTGDARNDFDCTSLHARERASNKQPVTLSRPRT